MPLFLLRFLPLILKAAPLAKKILPFLKNHWAIVLQFVILIVMSTMILVKNNTIDSLELDKVTYTRWQADSIRANATSQATIDVLRSANKALARAAEVSIEVYQRAQKKAREWELRAAIQLDDAKTKLKELENETPTCAEISRIDIGAACPLSVELLRRAAAGDFD